MKQTKIPISTFGVRKHGTLLLLIATLVLASCHKGDKVIFPQAGKIIPTSNDKATVATDWYKLQLRMILQAVPAKSNLAAIRLFAYSGIALYESSRFEISLEASPEKALQNAPSSAKFGCL